MNNRISRTVRTITLAASIALIAVLFLPLWRIDLTAPQYPEGLSLVIYANKLGGNVEVVNGLNHYIGMRTLHAADFPEFKVLPYLIGFFVVLGLMTFILKRRWMFYSLVFLFLLFAFVSMLDFYRWEYDYGHNLNPEAPIQVPGMSYQPPLLGFRQLLNFGVYSIPDSGGWIFIAVATALVVGAWLEWKKNRQGKMKGNKILLLLTLLGLCFSSCKQGPQPMKLGVDNCFFCRMTVTDSKYGAELITRKGRLYKFDDYNCLYSFVKSSMVEAKEIGSLYLVDYEVPHSLIKAEDAIVLKGGNLQSPMGSNVAAFSLKAAAQKLSAAFGAEVVEWKQIWDLQP